MSAFPAARRSAMKFCRWRCSSRACASSTKWIPASISTRCGSRLTASTRCARRIEQWKYTDLRMLMREVLPLAPAPDAKALKNAEAALKRHKVRGTRRLVLVDGSFAPKLSDTGDLEKGLTIRSLREVLEAGDAALQAQLF